MGLVIEATRKSASRSIGRRASTSIRPAAARCATLPRRASRVTVPAIFPPSTKRRIASSMRCNRADENPTSSGRTDSIMILPYSLLQDAHELPTFISDVF